jgi:outer membrane lipoprotein-sorting protein
MPRYAAAPGGDNPNVNTLLQRCPALAVAAILFFAAAVAHAAPVPAQLTQQDTLELQRIAAYLNNIRTMTARFQQTANNGGVSTGHLWVARPGRMRFEYDPPTPITLLADSASVYYWDKQLNQTSKYELRETPAWFFLRDPISFGADVVVTRFEHLGGIVRVTVVESGQPDAGSLTLDFSENPLTLRQWTVIDQQGKRTVVSLSDLQYGMALDPKLFQYQYLFTGSNR